MSTEEKPLSELISSIEQEDFVPSEDMNMGQETEPQEKKSKAFITIVLILLVLIIGVGGYYVYDNYIKEDNGEEEEEIVDEDEESTLQYRDFFIDQENGKMLYVKLPIAECEDVEYHAVTQANPDILVWEENGDDQCQLSYGLAYFKDEATMTGYYSSEAKYPLKTLTVGGVEYEIVFENGTYVQAGQSGSILYQKEPTITVGGYEAFRTIFVYGILPNLESRISDPETIIATYCTFDVSKLGENVSGYLVFNGSDSGTNYCKVLEDSENFELRIEQLGLL